MATTPKPYSKILFQKGQADLVSAPFYVGENRVALSAFANGTGLPPGARITFQEVVFVDGGRSDGTLCTPGQQHDSKQYDYKPFVSCGCEPALTERLSYMEIDRAGWYRAVYVGPSRASVMLTVMELSVQAGTGCCSKPCCPIEVDLVIDKAVSSEVIVSGGTGYFLLTLSNLGPDASRGGYIKDVLPAGLTYGVPVAVYAGLAAGSQPTIAQMIAGDWHYTSLPPGGTITITIPFTATSPGSCIPRSNTASIHPGKDEVDTNWVNNTDTVFYNIIKPTADVSITKTAANATLKENDPFSYTLVVSNAGPRPADGTIVTDVIPTGLVVSNIVATYASGAAGAQPTQAQLAAGYTIPTLPALGTVTIVVTGIAPTAGYYLNSASIKMPATVDDSDPTNNTASASLTVGGSSVDLSVSKTADKTSYGIEQLVTYTIPFSNAGPDAANGAILKDTLPATLSDIIIDVTFSGGAAAPVPSVATLAAGWVIPTLPAGGAGTLVISGFTTVTGVLTNTVNIIPPAGSVDINLSNNNATAIVVVNQSSNRDLCDAPIDAGAKYLTQASVVVCDAGVERPIQCGDKLRVVSDCCEVTLEVTGDSAGQSFAACIGVIPQAFDAKGRIIIQGRDASVVSGAANLVTNGIAQNLITETITNNSTCPMLVEFYLRPIANQIPPDFVSPQNVTFVYSIGETLALPVLGVGSGEAGSPLNQSVSHLTVSFVGANATPVEGQVNSVGIAGQANGAPAIYRKQLAPGQTVTVYGQWWVVIYQNSITPGMTTIHAGSALEVRKYIGGRLL